MGLISSIGNFISGGNQEKAAGATAASVEELRRLQLPDIEKMKLDLDELVSQGQISPEEATLYLQEQSQLSGISTDPRLQQAQMDALSSLQDISSSGGLTASDRAQLSRIQSDESTKARGAREAILQNAQARGMGGSGMEILSQLQNAQDTASRTSQRDLDVAGMAQERALQALMQAGQLGGQMQQQSFSQQAQQAAANDAINQFNAQNRQNVGNLNVQNRNQAQVANLSEKQRIADNNAALRNQQQQYNAQLQQQQFENAYKKAGGISGALQQQAANFQQTGAANQQLFGAGLQAGASIIKPTPAPAAASDERIKEHIEDFDPSEFLDSLTAKKFSYKDPYFEGEGRHGGVMAQDLEKTDVGRAMVYDSPRGKRVDFGKGFNTLLASMTDMHDRVKKLEKEKA